ncbi:protein-arginine deiminase domain-containing protein [Aspergillus melleus]|uniref:protein-arginine deiminase domain-containing protein n=1 Tax=Aspergillus melleus TaxID=138277 RepID=UPI001E8DFBD0|nr:uncharacterized protein LDX57_006921 [Aspergillus melleus]KAH8429254.1 hypothetical protein LDX57_006921 [Aspergillus melleus]
MALLRKLLGLLLLPIVVQAHGSPKADIRADTNRDGLVDLAGDSDLNGKSHWTETRGALFLPNIGDTDRRCSREALVGPRLSNARLDDCHDAADDIQRAPELMAVVRTVPMSGLSSNATGSISIAEEVARDNVRIFRPDGSSWVYVGSNHTFGQDELTAGLTLGVDGRDTRRPGGWDGRVTLQFTVRQGDWHSSDTVQLRVAPVLVHHHLQRVGQVLAVRGNASASPWVDRYSHDLALVVREAGLAADIHLFETGEDVWVQDFVEPGFATMPGPDGPVAIRIMIRSPQDERVAGRQLFESFRRSGVGAVQHLGGANEEINSGGNVEAVPPHSLNGRAWPAGRVLMGAHGARQHHLLPYLQAQETQEPILLDTDWLAIGHVDEFLQFLPADTERGWVAMVDDPRAAIDLLRTLRDEGHGGLHALSRNESRTPRGCNGWGCDPAPVPATTIEQLLSDEKLMQVNLRCADRIDANLDILKREVGLTDDAVLRIPALFRNHPFPEEEGPEVTQATLKVGAFFPGAVNNLVLTGFRTCVAPNPWGPSPNGTDVLAEAIRRQYAKLGIEIKFIDDWTSHHVEGGEVHCGSNTLRDMSQPWW